MAKTDKADLRQKLIGGLSVADWDKRWEALPNALSEAHPELRGVIGLIRFTLAGEIVYFVRGIETRGGLAKTIQRLRGPEQTGNSSFGAQQIRKNKSALDVAILRVETTSSIIDSRASIAAELKTAFNKLYDPQWNWPYKKRMANLRAGKVAR